MSVQRSLFDDTSGTSPVANGVDWIAGLLTGSIAVTLCVLAVALVGFLMLGGRVPAKRSFRVVIGCFILLGSAQIALVLSGLASSELSDSYSRNDVVFEDGRGDLPPSDYSPYTNPSQRQD